jgi:preprotein translocase subunit SecA
MQEVHVDPLTGENEVPADAPQPARGVRRTVDAADPSTWRRTPRNAACPCGSGKKYKHCHGRPA